MEFVRDNNLLHRLIIVDGIGKCGKSLLCELITSFESVEKQEFNAFMEYIALAYKFGKITKDIASTILKTEMDTELYHNMIGRYSNTRLCDATSIYKYHTPEKYLQRSLEKDGPVISEKVQKEKPIYLCWTHDLINKSDLIFETFDKKLDFIYINRRPIDIIYEWSHVGYSERMSKDPTDRQYSVKYKNSSVPQAAIGWEDEFLRCSPLERTTKLIYSLMKLNYEGLIQKQGYRNLHVFNFEDLVVDPYRINDNLKSIISTKQLPIFSDILKRENCPRELDNSLYLKRKTELEKNLSDDYIHLLGLADDMYKEICMISNGMPCMV